MRRWIGLSLLVMAATIGWLALRDLRRGYRSALGTRVVHFSLHSRLLRRRLSQVLVTPRGGGRGRPLLVFLHGRGASPGSNLTDPFFRGLRALGSRAPDVLFANGGDHSYWHDRADGPWGSYVLREAIPAALARSRADPQRVAIGGISMGGFGALDLARIAPGRFCAVGGHSAAMWFRGADTPAGAFDNAADFDRNDLVGLAGSRSPYGAPVWIDVGTDDPFRQADTALAHELRADGARVTFHVWPGGHESSYWHRHIGRYLRFYATACGA
ncbi:MAG TPA: alpha/beta hydrolase-fold protein [Gaiellaceae bacterium]|nr:alpha/beta hydrolase-fold protein [Gaiellaceae bacterium]